MLLNGPDNLQNCFFRIQGSGTHLIHDMVLLAHPSKPSQSVQPFCKAQERDQHTQTDHATPSVEMDRYQLSLRCGLKLVITLPPPICGGNRCIICIIVFASYYTVSGKKVPMYRYICV